MITARLTPLFLVVLIVFNRSQQSTIGRFLLVDDQWPNVDGFRRQNITACAVNVPPMRGVLKFSMCHHVDFFFGLKEKVGLVVP